MGMPHAEHWQGSVRGPGTIGVSGGAPGRCQVQEDSIEVGRGLAAMGVQGGAAQQLLPPAPPTAPAAPLCPPPPPPPPPGPPPPAAFSNPGVAPRAGPPAPPPPGPPPPPAFSNPGVAARAPAAAGGGGGAGPPAPPAPGPPHPPAFSNPGVAHRAGSAAAPPPPAPGPPPPPAFINPGVAARQGPPAPPPPGPPAPAAFSNPGVAAKPGPPPPGPPPPPAFNNPGVAPKAQAPGKGPPPPGPPPPPAFNNPGVVAKAGPPAPPPPGPPPPAAFSNPGIAPKAQGPAVGPPPPGPPPPPAFKNPGVAPKPPPSPPPPTSPTAPTTLDNCGAAAPALPPAQLSDSNAISTSNAAGGPSTGSGAHEQQLPNGIPHGSEVIGNGPSKAAGKGLGVIVPDNNGSVGGKEGVGSRQGSSCGAAGLFSPSGLLTPRFELQEEEEEEEVDLPVPNGVDALVMLLDKQQPEFDESLAIEAMQLMEWVLVAKDAAKYPQLIAGFCNRLLEDQAAYYTLLAELCDTDNDTLITTTMSVKNAVFNVVRPYQEPQPEPEPEPLPLPPPPPPAPKPLEPRPPAELNENVLKHVKELEEAAAQQNQTPQGGPPPKIDLGVPPPPPPPPVPLPPVLAPGAGNAVRPPPPPPPKPAGFAAAPQLKAKPVPPPPKKLKPLFWDLVPAPRLKGTFWVEENGEAVPLPALDWDHMADMFAQAAPKPKGGDGTAGGPAEEAKPKQISVIDAKRGHNINILMGGKIKIPIPKLREAILGLDPRIFGNDESIAALRGCVPTADELLALAAHKAANRPTAEIADADRVMMELASVPHVEERLRCYAHKYAIPDKISQASKVFEANLAVVGQLRSSGCFKQALRVALAAGNYLNHGTRNGAAIGFRLKNLPKLADSKSTDGKSTLLQVLAAEVLRLQLGADSPASGSGDKEPVVLADEVPDISSSMLKVSHDEAAKMMSEAETMIQEISTFLENFTPATTPLSPGAKKPPAEAAKDTPLSPGSKRALADTATGTAASPGGGGGKPSSPGEASANGQGATGAEEKPGGVATGASGSAILGVAVGTGTTNGPSSPAAQKAAPGDGNGEGGKKEEGVGGTSGEGSSKASAGEQAADSTGPEKGGTCDGPASSSSAASDGGVQTQDGGTGGSSSNVKAGDATESHRSNGPMVPADEAKEATASASAAAAAAAPGEQGSAPPDKSQPQQQQREEGKSSEGAPAAPAAAAGADVKVGGPLAEAGQKLHGDAADATQGKVAESLSLSKEAVGKVGDAGKDKAGDAAAKEAGADGIVEEEAVMVIDSFKEVMSQHLAILESNMAVAQQQQGAMKQAYDQLLAWFGENANSTPSDVEFWAALAVFVDKFSGAQRALLAERKDREEKEARRKERERSSAALAAAQSHEKQSMAATRERLLATTPLNTPPATGPPSSNAPDDPAGQGTPTPLTFSRGGIGGAAEGGDAANFMTPPRTLATDFAAAGGGGDDGTANASGTKSPGGGDRNGFRSHSGKRGSARWSEGLGGTMADALGRMMSDTMTPGGTQPLGSSPTQSPLPHPTPLQPLLEVPVAAAAFPLSPMGDGGSPQVAPGGRGAGFPLTPPPAGLWESTTGLPGSAAPSALTTAAGAGSSVGLERGQGSTSLASEPSLGLPSGSSAAARGLAAASSP